MSHEYDYDEIDRDPIARNDCDKCGRLLFGDEACKCRTCTACEKAERLPGEELCGDCRKLYCASCGERIIGWFGGDWCEECIRDESGRGAA